MDIYEADQLRWMALAYMDSGLALATSIIEDDFESSPHRDLVPIFLIHQALELMFKSALKLKLGEFPKTHDIEKLYQEFVQHYPDLAFDIPEGVLVPKSKNLLLFPELELRPVIQHERLRYPTDRKGIPWPDADKVVLEEIYEELSALNGSVIKIWNALNQVIEDA